MSVLSCSEVFVGEQSPATNPVEDIFEESTLLQVNCPEQRTVEKTLITTLGRSNISFKVGCPSSLSHDGQLKGDKGEDETSMKLQCPPENHLDQLVNGIATTGKGISGVENSEIWQDDEQSPNSLQGHSNFTNSDAAFLAVCNLSNGVLEHVDVKQQNPHNEGIGQCRTTLNLLPDSRCDEEDVGVEQGGISSIGSLCESNNNLSSTAEAQRNEVYGVEERVDASDTLEFVLCDASNSHAQDAILHIPGHEHSDPLSRPNVEQITLGAQGYNDGLLLAGNKVDPHKQKLDDENIHTSNRGTEFSSCKADSPGGDHALPLWVKWRGKWQTGILCPKSDCPLSTLRAKPTHERKNYFAVFFPRTRTYSWADKLLVRSINELPEPLVHGTHRKWRKLVKDLTMPRRYIMQKLAVKMLNLSDQIHPEAVIENARKANTWKEFAVEASQCRDYSDLGRMLLKLQTMILSTYVSQNWLEVSWDSWAWRCQTAQSAESIEILTEELLDSVLWNEVEKLWDAHVQPELGPEWKTWKQEALKWFSTSHPIANCGVVEQNYDISESVGSQVSRKRPKLEVRRADIYASQRETAEHLILSQASRTEPVSGVDNSQSIGTYEAHNLAASAGVAGRAYSATTSNRWNETAFEGEDMKFVQNSGDVLADKIQGQASATKSAHDRIPIKSYRQCSAFIEAKGRHCGRWANDGDVYCCVHLNAHSVGKPTQHENYHSVERPMCGGMTTHGERCKHRARYGSTFCKKHGPQGTNDQIHTDYMLDSFGGKLKHKFAADTTLNTLPRPKTNPDIESEQLGEVPIPVQENLIPIMVGETMDEKNCLMKKSELTSAFPSPVSSTSVGTPRCIGYYRQNNHEHCIEDAKRHTLYCEKHLPKFLKRARNGKSRLISKDVFLDLLKDCSSRKQKVCLHQACELLYEFMKSNLSRQKLGSKESDMSWVLSEATNDLTVGEFLLKLVSSEREKIMGIWGFDVDMNEQKSSSAIVIPTFEGCDKNVKTEMTVRCKICSEEFCDDQTLGIHWTEVHKKEARWLFRGFACAICMSSFSNRKVLETHVKARHGEQFLEHSILFRCMSCCSHFPNPDQLWQHVLSLHSMNFRLQNSAQQLSNIQDHGAQSEINLANKLFFDESVSQEDGSHKFVCRFCGLKFDLLPDLGRHHQVAHVTQFPLRRGNPHLRRSRHGYPRFKKGLGDSYKVKNRSTFGVQKHLQSSNSTISASASLQANTSEFLDLGRLLESHCSDIAKTLFSKISKTKPRPSNVEILSVARSACCRISLHAALEVKFGVLPESTYLKAAKLCSEQNIRIDWHVDGFICPNGCKPLCIEHSLAPLKPLPCGFAEPPRINSAHEPKWEMDECHYILDPVHFGWKPVQNAIVLFEDVSFGKEPVPVACVIDAHLKDSLQVSSSYNQRHDIAMPWQGFTYVTERLIDPSLGLETKNSQLGCACPDSQCCSEECDHVYLFDNDYENAEDIYGNSMRGKFPYDERGRIILQEGHLVYECNSMCNCKLTCQNRVLQKGIQVKLEVFKTEKKGWAVRAGEAISRGTFVCEYIGEVLTDAEANKRGERYDTEGCSYLYDIDAHVDSTGGLSEGTVSYGIDATNYGNVSRFINHSCSPNLVNYLVLVESMDCQLAHIGLYASRDIAVGEELAYDYHHKLLPGDGCVCHCGAPNCRGRLC